MKNFAQTLRRASKPRAFLLVLSAPSGGGKTTVCDLALRKLPWLKRCVTATTRAPRKGERHGRDYWFLSHAEFHKRIKAGGFYEWAEVHGNLYGTPKAEVLRALKAGHSLVLVIDVQGAASVARKAKDAVSVFLLPPSLHTLAERLVLRGAHDARDLKRRLREARHEIAQAPLYDYVVVNDQLHKTVEHVTDIARAERWRF